MLEKILSKNYKRTKDEPLSEKLIIPESFGKIEMYTSKMALWFEKNWNGSKRYVVESNNENYYVEEGIIYQRNPKKLMLVLPIKCDEFTFPQNVEEIANDALKFCDIKKVIIPDDFTNELPKLGGEFEEIIVRGSISAVNCDAFANNEKLCSVILPDYKIRIGEGAFKGCTNLSELVLPSFYNLTVVETECMRTAPNYDRPLPFADCIHLRKLKSGQIVEEWDPETATLTISGSGVFEGSVFGRDFFVSPEKVVIGGGIKKINASLGPINYHGIRLYRRGCKDSLNTLIMQEGIEEIALFAFAGCEKLKKVFFPQSLKKIGEKAFFDCTALEVPDISKISVEKKAFWGCVNTPYIEADYEHTIFCGQRKIFIESDEKNYYLDYKKAISLLEKFCKDRVYKHDVTIYQNKDCVSAGWSYSNFHYHDAYEYDKGASVKIKRISKEEYCTASENIKKETSEHGYLNSSYKAIQDNSAESFVRKIKEDSASCKMLFYCKNLLGIVGYFEIYEKHWNTM